MSSHSAPDRPYPPPHHHPLHVGGICETRSPFDYSALMAVTELGSYFNWTSIHPILRPLSVHPSQPALSRKPPVFHSSLSGIRSYITTTTTATRNGAAASRSCPDDVGWRWWWWWWCNGCMLHVMMNYCMWLDGSGEAPESSRKWGGGPI